MAFNIPLEGAKLPADGSFFLSGQYQITITYIIFLTEKYQ